MYDPGDPLSASEKARMAAIKAEVELEKKRRAERIKRCEEDPVFAAEFERSLQEKMAANRGISGSRWGA